MTGGLLSRWPFGQWPIGTMAYWHGGLLGRWPFGTVAYWDVGLLGRWPIGMVALWLVALWQWPFDPQSPDGHPYNYCIHNKAQLDEP